MPLAELPSHPVWYDTAGDTGTPVLFIMGLAMPGRAWHHQIPAISAKHRVIWFDNRGVGGSGTPPRPWAMADLAADAIGLLDHLGFERAHLVGVSMGGMVAQHVALGWRDRLHSLTLIATHAGGLGSRRPTLNALYHGLGVRLSGRRRRRHHLERLLFPADFLEDCDRNWLDETLNRDFGTPPPLSTVSGQFRAVIGHDTRSRLSELEGLPTLIIKPGRDVLIRPQSSERLHQAIPGSRLVEIAEAGHGVIRQSWERLNPLLLEHFAGAE